MEFHPRDGPDRRNRAGRRPSPRLFRCGSSRARPLYRRLRVGSHLDSQPTGGKYDGAYGVLSALEIARSVYAAGRRPTRSLEIVSFANEEGARFAPPMMGSGVFTGKLDLEAMLDTQDFEGRTVRGEIGKDATGNFDTRPQRTIDSFFEIHIEQ